MLDGADEINTINVTVTSHGLVRNSLLVFSEYGTKPHNDGGKGRFDVLVGVCHQLLNVGQNVVHNNGLLLIRVQILAKISDLKQ